MTSTSRAIPHPFEPVKSFLAVACGEEKIELKDEWKRVFEPSDRAGERKAA